MLQMALLFLLMLVSILLAFLVYFAVAKFIIGIEDPRIYLSSKTAQLQNVPMALFANSMISSVGCFMLPAILFAAITRIKPAVYLKLTHLFSLKEWLIVTFLMIFASFFLSMLVEINKAIPLPASLAYLREAGKESEELIKGFFQGIDSGRFLLLTISLAVLPAVSEELFFRGALLRIFSGFSHGFLLPIAMSAFVFSVFHLQFDNMLGIWFMGAVLGCVYWFTQNLWMSIWAHFLNNFSIVVLKSLFLFKITSVDISEVESVPMVVSAIGGAITFGLLFLLYKNYKEQYLFTAENTTTEI